MKLDERITGKIYDPFDIETTDVKSFIGSYGFFTNSRMDYVCLENTTYGVLTKIDDCENNRVPYITGSETYHIPYSYFIPEQRIKHIPGKNNGKPFTLTEFKKKFRLNQSIHIREMHSKREYVLVFAGYCLTDNCVCLGGCWYTMKDLFDHEYEREDGTWVRFISED